MKVEEKLSFGAQFYIRCGKALAAVCSLLWLIVFQFSQQMEGL